MRRINEIFIHCSATKPQWMINAATGRKINEIRRWHVEERGWSDIGYHYLIDRNGKLAEGRPVKRAGAHVKGHNSNSIGICLIGGHGGAATDKFEDHYTEDQRKTLMSLLKDLTVNYPNAKIRGHNEVAAKACPSFNVKEFLNHEQTKDVQEGSGYNTASLFSIINLLLGLLRK